MYFHCKMTCEQRSKCALILHVADEAAGGSDDWFKGGNDAKYAYTVELPGGGQNGFDPPPSDIKPIVTETFEGLKVVGNFIGKNRKK